MLKRLLILPIFAAALVASCGVGSATTGPPVPVSVNQGSGIAEAVGDTVMVPATQSLIVAHNAYQGAAAAVTAYANSGAMTPGQASRLRALNDQAFALLEKGGDGLSIADRAAGVFNIVAEINRTIGRSN